MHIIDRRISRIAGARNRQAMQSGTHFAKTGGFRSHGTRLSACQRTPVLKKREQGFCGNMGRKECKGRKELVYPNSKLPVF